MPAHYGVAVIADAYKNAINVVLALWQSENPALSENIGQPLNASGDWHDPITHWVGGRQYQAAELEVFQDLAANLPTAPWPVMGVGGPVSEAEAIAAATALYLLVGTAESYSTPLAQQTLTSALGARGLKLAVEE